MLEYLKLLPGNEDLQLKDLTQKLAVIMALTNAARASDIQALDIRFLRITEEGARFQIPGLTKTRRSGPPLEAFYPVFTEDPDLCPVKNLQAYIDRTEDLRRESTNKPLFIALKKPHAGVTASTISRWLKEVMQRAGIDTGVFKPHSTRSASVSAAKRRGVSTSDILKAAQWSRESTFQRFYYRPLDSSDFGIQVLRYQEDVSTDNALNYTLSYMKPCNDVELVISQASFRM